MAGTVVSSRRERLHTDLLSRVSRRTNIVKRDFDLIVYGATGYTGRLIAEYLATSYRGDDAPSWAIAGRSTDKLQKVRADIGAPDDLPLVKADAAEPASLRSMCEHAAVIITAVGPYQLHGPELVAACAATGTAYVDLCGEPAWMRRMIDAHHEEAKRTGARIVFSCGFDSIPFDLGVLTLQEKAREKFGRPARRVKARLRKVKGGMSGGTAASAQATLAAAARDPGPDPAADRSLRVDAGVHRAVSAVGPHPRIRPEHERVARAVPNGADQHQERAPHEFPVGPSLRHGLRLRRDDGRAGIWGNRSRDDGDVRHDGFLGRDRRSQTRRRPDSGRAREGLLRHPLPGRAAGWRTGRGGSHRRPRSGLRLDQQDDRRERSLPRARRAGRGRHLDAGRADGSGVAQASEGARRPHLQRALR